MYSGIYIHIPFCRDRCIYCDFVAVDLNNKKRNELIREYSIYLSRELELRLENFQSRYAIKTLYFGGGTPSLLDYEEFCIILEKLAKYINISDLCEVTIEVNPEDVNDRYALLLKKLGLNRVSLGIQSMDDRVLKSLYRHNTSKTNEYAIKTLLDHGIENINCDFIFNIPTKEWVGVNETEFLNSLLESLIRVIEWGVKHISAYSFTIEDFTPLSYFVRNNTIKVYDNFDKEFEEIHKLLVSMGFRHYEISNYSLEGFQSIHNVMYWKRYPFVGCGTGAWGFVNNKRYQNEIKIKSYFHSLRDNVLPEVFSEQLGEKETFNEIIMLGLRVDEGVSMNDVCGLISGDNLKSFLNKVTNLSKQGFLEINGDRLKPTIKGWIFHNMVSSELLL